MRSARDEGLREKARAAGYDLVKADDAGHTASLALRARGVRLGLGRRRGDPPRRRRGAATAARPAREDGAGPRGPSSGRRFEPSTRSRPPGPRRSWGGSSTSERSRATAIRGARSRGRSTQRRRPRARAAILRSACAAIGPSGWPSATACAPLRAARRARGIVAREAVRDGAGYRDAKSVAKIVPGEGGRSRSRTSAPPASSAPRARR